MKPRQRIFLYAVSFALLLLIFPSFAAASVVHRVDVGEDSANVTSLMTLTSDEKVNTWELSVDLPENSEVRSIADARGDINYTWNGSRVRFKTNSGPLRSREKVMINFTVEDVRAEEFSPVDSIKISLFGFSGEAVKAEVHVENVLSWHTPLNFRSGKENSTLRFEGEGSLPLYIYTSEKGNQSEHYHYFSNREEVMDAEEFYPVIPHIMGVRGPHEVFPIVFLNDSAYDTAINGWSSGRYKTGGLIVIREGLSEDDMTPTIIHETAHGFNSGLLRWDSTETAYFDEGVAKFFEFLVKQKMGVPQAEIFGDRVNFRKDGSGYYLQPRSTPDELWSYYRGNRGGIKDWNPWREDSKEARRFGYAYSELLIREFVEENGVEALRNVSRELLEIDRRVESTEEKWRIFSDILGDMKPCYPRSREDFDSCLESINGQEFNISGFNITVDLGPGEESGNGINISEEDFQLPETEEKGLVSKVKSFLRSIIEELRWILRKL